MLYYNPEIQKKEKIKICARCKRELIIKNFRGGTASFCRDCYRVYKKDLIKKLDEEGIESGEIAKLCGVTVKRIYQILNNRKNITTEQKERILKRDNKECQSKIICNGEGVKFQIHHVDFDPSNGDDYNLITLCSYCHTYIHKLTHKYKPCLFCGDAEKSHGKQYKGKRCCKECYKKNKLKQKSRWSSLFDKCIECGTTEKKYHSKGFCVTCHARERYKDPAYREKHRIAMKKMNKKKKERNKV